MKRKQVVLLALLGLAAAFVLVLALRNPQPPLMPRDAQHASFESADACLECHAPGRPVPQAPAHPVGRDCTRCHGTLGPPPGFAPGGPRS